MRAVCSAIAWNALQAGQAAPSAGPGWLRKHSPLQHPPIAAHLRSTWSTSPQRPRHVWSRMEALSDDLLAHLLSLCDTDQR